MNQTTPPLFRRDFTLVVLGQIISLFGNAVLRFALPLYLLRETGSPALFGAVTAAAFLPMILLSLTGGVVADRVNKRSIMVMLDFTTAALIGTLGLLLGRMPLVPLFAAFLMLLYGISGAYQPAVQASVPLLVPGPRLMEGNAVINQVSTLANLLGPVLGGLLFHAWGLEPILAVSGICFVCSAVMELFIRMPHTPRGKAEGLLAAAAGDLRESCRFLRRERPALISVVAVLALFNLALTACLIVGIPVMVVQTLRLGDTALGAAQGVQGLGGLAGGLLAGRLAPRLRLGRTWLPLALCGLTAACMGAALLPGVPAWAGYGVILAAVLTATAASTLVSIQLCTAIQHATPPHLVGKVMAAVIAASMCTQPVGQAAYGVLFDLLAGLPWLPPFLAAAASLAISLASRRTFRRLENMV